MMKRKERSLTKVKKETVKRRKRTEQTKMMNKKKR